MNQKTAKLIRKTIDKKFPNEDNTKRYKKAKRDWNSTPKPDRWLSRKILKSFLKFDETSILTSDATSLQ